MCARRRSRAARKTAEHHEEEPEIVGRWKRAHAGDSARESHGGTRGDSAGASWQGIPARVYTLSLSEAVPDSLSVTVCQSHIHCLSHPHSRTHTHPHSDARTNTPRRAFATVKTHIHINTCNMTCMAAYLSMHAYV